MHEVEVKLILKIEVSEEEIKEVMDDEESEENEAVKSIIDDAVEEQMSQIEFHDYHIESIKKIITLSEKEVVEEDEKEEEET